MSMTARAKAAWAAGTAVSVLTVISLTITLWGAVGWTTPAQHQADIDTLVAQRTASESAIIEVLEKNQDEWKCDEYDEELKAARIMLAQAETPRARAEIEHEIEKIVEAMETRECSRFEDFG